MLIELEFAKLNLMRDSQNLDNIAVVRIGRLENRPIHDNLIAQPCGWGGTSSTSPGVNDVLREISVPTMSNDACKVAWGGHVYPGLICTASSGGSGLCTVRLVGINGN